MEMTIEQTISNLLSTLPSEDIINHLEPLALQRYITSRRMGKTKQVAALPRQGQVGSVAVVEVSGVLVREAYWSDDVSTSALTMMFDSLAADQSVKAVVLNIDSPGGTASGMHDLYQSAVVLGEAKPLFAHVSDYAASAAYYLAAAAQAIYGGPRTTVGSIGTRMQLFDWSQLFENMGVESVTIDTGEFKSLGAFGSKITENQRAHLQHLVDLYQEDFSQAVKTGRHMTDQEFDAIADGRVFLAEEAVGLKLLNGVQTLASTIEVAEAIVAETAVNQRKKKMSEEKTIVEPQAATLAELKDNLPGASSDFMLEQLEKKSTVQESMKAFLANQQSENETLKQEKSEAEEKAAAAEKKAGEPKPVAKKRGNVAIGQKVANTDPEGEETDYRQMAMEYKEKHNCRWSEACVFVKRRYPEAQKQFGMPPE